MNVGAAGAGSPGLDPPGLDALAKAVAGDAARLRLPSLSHVSTHDTVSSSLTEPAIQLLLHVIEERLFPVELRHGGLSAASGHPQSHMASLETVGIEGKVTAEKSVAAAFRLVETAGAHSPRVSGRPDPQLVLALANQLIATGQALNYLRAAELGYEVAAWYRAASPALATVGEERVTHRRYVRLRGGLRRLFVRAPLLILLSGWLLAGVAGGLLLRIMNVAAYKMELIFDIWGIGFLSLVVFQFVVTVRGALRLRARR